MIPYFEDDSCQIFRMAIAGRYSRSYRPRIFIVFADSALRDQKGGHGIKFPAWAIPLMLAAGKTLAITPGETAFKECVIALGGAITGRCDRA